MYRIRLHSGEQAVFKTVEELAAAVSSGVVSPTAEVFHKAANRWLPINTHPDYRALVTGKRPALPDSAPAEPSTQRHTPETRKSDAADLSGLELLPAQPEPLAPAAVSTPPSGPAVVPATIPMAGIPLTGPVTPSGPQPAVDLIDLTAQSEQETLPALAPMADQRRQPIALVAILAGAIVTAAAMAADLMSSPARPAPAPVASRTASDSIRAATAALDPAIGRPAHPPAGPGPVASTAGGKPPVSPTAPKQATVARPRVDTVPVTFPAPSKPLAGRPAVPAAGAAAQPGAKTTSRLGSSVSKTPSYYEAYADARAEMDESLAYVDFKRVFSPARFSTADSIRAARRMVAAAGNILRVYRGREVQLEQTYRAGEGDRGSLRESFEVSEASRSLLADVDSLFAILVAQEGEVRFKDNMMQFQNPSAALAYNRVRREILQTLSYLGDPAEAADHVTMPRLLRGLGSDRPPPAR